MTRERRTSKDGMDRRRFLALASGAAAASAVGWPAGAVAQTKREPIVMRIAHSEAIGSPMTEAFEKWANLLKEKSGGRLDAQHFPASQLGSYTQLIEQNRLGTIQVMTGGPDTEAGIAPEIAVTGLGFIFQDEGHVDRVLLGRLGDQFSEIARKKTGVEFVAYGEVGFRHLLSKRKVANRAELRGLKLRVPEIKLWIDFWRALGANPTPLAYAEQYTALSTGVIDGLEADVFSIQGFKWYEQAKFLTLTDHWFLPKAVRVNAKWLDGLPADLQKLIRDSAKEVFAEQRAINRKNTGATLLKLKELGVQVTSLADRAEWLGATQPLYDAYMKQYPESKPFVEGINALRKPA